MRYGLFQNKFNSVLNSWAPKRRATALVTQISGALKGEQITGINPNKSDHKGLAVKVSKGKKLIALVGNELKQCVPHNNGFGKEESVEEYLERYFRQIDARCEYIKKHSFKLTGNTATGVMSSDNQESVIQEDHIAKKKERMEANGVYGDHYHTKDGVSTFFPEAVAKAFFQVPVDSTRLLLFRSSDTYYKANFHTPWPDKEALAEAVKKASAGSDPERIRLELFKQEYKKLVCMVLAADNLPKEDGVPLITVDLAADTNLPPDMQFEAVKEVCAEMAAERVRNGLPSFSVISYSVGSPDGHVQKKDGKDEYVDVDSYRRLLITRSVDPKVHQFEACPTKNSAREKLRLAIGALVSAGLIFLGNPLGDDVAFEAVLAVAAADPKLAQEISHAISASVTSGWSTGGPALLAPSVKWHEEKLCELSSRSFPGFRPGGIA